MKYLFLALSLLFFSSLKAQTTFSSGHLHATLVDSAVHDSAACQAYCHFQFHVTVDSSFVGDSVMAIDTFTHSLIANYHNTTGASPWIFDCLGTARGQSDNVPPGSYIHLRGYIVRFKGTSDTIGVAIQSDSVLVVNPCEWGYVSGHVYADMNSNCLYDAGDEPLHIFQLKFKEHLFSPVDSIFGGGTSWFNAASGFSPGNYTFLVQKSWMTNYTISMPPEFAFIFPTSPCFSGTSYVFDTVGCTNADFPLQCSTNIDVMVGAMTPEKVRAHNAFYIQPYVSNIGCDTASGTYKLVLDSHVIYNPALSSIPPDTVHGDTLIWNYHGISSLTGGAYWNNPLSNIYLMPDSTVGLGDTLCFIAYTGVLPADIDAANNYRAFCLPVVYSYDPNSKDVSPVGQGPQGYIPAAPDTLTYTIHFQNTGSDYAQNVIVRDTLNSNFNMHTLEILGSSHHMVPKWVATNVVEFHFDNIFLLDSFTNEPKSHGQVSFSIVLNSGVPHGTPIKNTGYIYFDTNPAVITNTTLNTIALVNSVANVSGLPPKVYPNPATDVISIDNLNAGTLSIFNISGQELMRFDVTSTKMNIDVSRLPAGVYILKSVSDANTATVRFTKY